MADLSTVLQLLTDPRVGLPIVIVGIALLLWAVRAPRGRPRLRGFDPPVPEPIADPVSRAMHAIRYEAYAELLREAYVRLDRGSRRRTGAPLSEIRRSKKGASPLARPVRRRLEKLGRRIESEHDYAIRLDAGTWVRYDFWRTLSESRRRLRSRTDVLFSEVDRALPLFGGPA